MFHLLHDELPHELTRRNREAQRIAWRLGLSPKPARRFGTEELPPNLCQRLVAAERRLAVAQVYRFIDALERGDEVIFLTVCRPEWTCAEGELSTRLICDVRGWMSRRARNLARYGQQRMMGFVDVAWNDRSAVGEVSHWSVHAHVLLVVEGVREGARQLCRSAFSCDGDGDRVLKPIVAKTLSTDLDVFRVGRYNSRALLLEHHQRRRSYRDRNGVAQTRDTKLTVTQAVELAAVVHRLGPKRFWILSGLRRKFGEIQANG
ncbi:hypothetical protein [Brevundimonas sp.]|uniref:hypothetical protein n=1 Tax=Brevundimonas sp. TaxID=1871086 RepID=UPI002D2DB38F|nr:hypothetical protein [Brevundimonas sp.]HYC68897.1 hypothetical protein [Brevundimonas sp.]